MFRQKISRSPFVLIPQHFGCLVFDRAESRYLPFDRELTELLVQLRHHPPREVAQAVEDGSGFEQLLLALFDRGLLAPDGRFAGEVLDVVPPADHLTGPLTVHLELIGACNLTCSHCFAGALPRNHAPLKLNELAGLFDELAAIGSFRLGLTGGEPLLRKDLFEIIDEASSRGLCPSLTTNGLLIDETIARKLGGCALTWLNVSLEGATAATNDAVRGRGVYDKVRDRLKLLSRHARFSLAFTITSANAGEVEACAALAHEVGAAVAVFRPLYPTGVALKHPELMPTYAQYAGALERLERLTLVGVGASTCGVEPLPPSRGSANQSNLSTWQGCGAGQTICSVSVQGEVNPCSFMGSAHDAGNIRERPFREIWDSSQGFRKIRDRERDRAGFEGGCRARAQAAHGSVHAPDPWLEAWRDGKGRHPKANVEVAVPVEAQT